MTDAASYGKAAAEWQLSTIDDLSYLRQEIRNISTCYVMNRLKTALSLVNVIGTVTTKFSELFMRALLNAIRKLA